MLHDHVDRSKQGTDSFTNLSYTATCRPLSSSAKALVLRTGRIVRRTSVVVGGFAPGPARVQAKKIYQRALSRYCATFDEISGSHPEDPGTDRVLKLLPGTADGMCQTVTKLRRIKNLIWRRPAGGVLSLSMPSPRCASRCRFMRIAF